MLFLSGIIQCQVCNRESSIKIAYEITKPASFEIEGWFEEDGQHFCPECYGVKMLSKLLSSLTAVESVSVESAKPSFVETELPESSEISLDVEILSDDDLEEIFDLDDSEPSPESGNLTVASEYSQNNL